ncbi:hypothetical protein N4T57_05675 [Campylobacter hepaticus]|uniref:Uncharacterized protein n=1 Tax=Campylobacter hepaticus TaxID=1813019 RepID=A0A6A7JRW3_9BACT|nr:hypothetical protein [Campylobacter hepaticus]AXP08775.1 hypothetical protein A2J15_003505 [Campylobacter hepaticus]MCZ0772626.1 hypothetical protein [Campylobacter hepaticus]MCZ0774094.1 hypothetical protein [Campylobacter hepaticus]MCZ0775346.1 hypothetical protein [Campylobacter hepaticus]MDX2323058.1 hypothetical protein [Campylobacter hepaticus]
MILEFDFIYSANNDIFEYLLRFYAKDYHYALEKQGDTYRFVIEGDEEKLKLFCDSLKLMSHSIFLKKFDVKIGEKFSSSCIEDQDFLKFSYITHLNSSAYQEKKVLSKNEWGVFCESYFSSDLKEFHCIDETCFNVFLDQAFSLLLKDKSIYIKDKKGIYELALFKDDFTCDFLVPCDIKAINSAFICSNENLKFLASLEKPLIKLRLNAMFRKNHNLKFHDFKIRLAQDLFCFALGFKLFEDGYKFLSVKKIKEYEKDFQIVPLDNQFVVLEGFEFINIKAKELIFSKEDKNMARISYMLSLYGEKAFILELSKNYEDILLVNKELNLLQLSLPKDSKELYDEIKKDEIGAKLLENFAKEFPLLNEDFILKNNFYSLFCLVGRVLNLDTNLQKAGEELLKIADESKMPRGVKIDYRLKENKSFDYTRTVRSVMSFMLAGVDSLNIAYGVVESLAYFLRDTYDDLRDKNLSELALISGSLFEHKALLKNTLKHLKNCQLSNVPLRI